MRVVGAIAVHGADDFVGGVADACEDRGRDAAVDFMFYQSAILAGSEQAIEQFPGTIGTAVVDEYEVGVVVLGKEFADAFEGVGKIGQRGALVEARYDDRYGDSRDGQSVYFDGRSRGLGAL